MKLGVFMLWTEMRVAPPDAMSALAVPARAALPETLSWGGPPPPAEPVAVDRSSALPRRGDSTRMAPRPVKSPRRKKSRATLDAVFSEEGTAS